MGTSTLAGQGWIAIPHLRQPSGASARSYGRKLRRAGEFLVLVVVLVLVIEGLWIQFEDDNEDEDEAPVSFIGGLGRAGVFNPGRWPGLRNPGPLGLNSDLVPVGGNKVM